MHTAYMCPHTYIHAKMKTEAAMAKGICNGQGCWLQDSEWGRGAIPGEEIILTS